MSLVAEAESQRRDVRRGQSPADRAELGQFFTPGSVARFMASWSQPAGKVVRMLDPGAGVGSLSAAWIEAVLGHEARPTSIHLTAVEIDERLRPQLENTLQACRAACRARQVAFSAEIVMDDFVSVAAGMLGTQSLLDAAQSRYDCVVMNPPYCKINSDSPTRRRLRRLGLETSNLYAAFLWLASRLLEQGGELIAITPRSFCNGPYFRPFRLAFLKQMEFTRIHVFESRKAAFQEDAVLQENVIFRAAKTKHSAPWLVVSKSNGPGDLEAASTRVPHREVVSPDDPEKIIHIVPESSGKQVARRIKSFSHSLRDLGIDVSTGRVVDFRVRKCLVASFDGNRCQDSVAPLIYPTHLERGSVVWPKEGKKPNLLRIVDETAALLVPQGNYVLVKRFSAKEERRRVIAAVCRGTDFDDVGLAFENHLNFFHCQGRGLSGSLAAGLAAYLNSTLLDSFFRQFSGHTQVNATDLRALPYPSRDMLEEFGRLIGKGVAEQERIDTLLDEFLSAGRV